MTQETPLWLLDVDGVINAVPNGQKWRGVWPDMRAGEASPYENPTTEDHRFPINWSPTVTTRIRTLHEAGLVEVQWLTTWGGGANLELAALVGLPKFKVVEEPDARSGRLPYLAWWKFEAAKDVAAENPGRKVVWTDDDLRSEPLAMNFARDSGWLAVAPNTRDGLTPKHVAQIEEYIRATKKRAA